MFQTRPRSKPKGRPRRAQGCRCPESWEGPDGECVRCGRYLEATVSETFARQTRRFARGQRDSPPKQELDVELVFPSGVAR